MTDLLYEKEGARQEGRREGIRIGETRGIAIGEARGEKRAQIEAEKAKENAAKGFLNAGVPIEVISEQLGLSKEKILSL